MPSKARRPGNVLGARNTFQDSNTDHDADPRNDDGDHGVAGLDLEGGGREEHPEELVMRQPVEDPRRADEIAHGGEEGRREDAEHHQRRQLVDVDDHLNRAYMKVENVGFFNF